MSSFSSGLSGDPREEAVEGGSSGLVAGAMSKSGGRRRLRDCLSELSAYSGPTA